MNKDLKFDSETGQRLTSVRNIQYPAAAYSQQKKNKIQKVYLSSLRNLVVKDVCNTILQHFKLSTRNIMLLPTWQRIWRHDTRLHTFCCVIQRKIFLLIQVLAYGISIKLWKNLRAAPLYCLYRNRWQNIVLSRFTRRFLLKKKIQLKLSFSSLSSSSSSLLAAPVGA